MSYTERVSKRSPDERSDIRGLRISVIPHVAALMRATYSSYSGLRVLAAATVFGIASVTVLQSISRSIWK